MNSGIYCILNLINGKRYIGQTINLKRRKNDHFNDLKGNRHRNPHLQYAFNHYGQDNFEFIIITQCSEDELDDLEQFYIKQLNTMDRKYGYNLDSGGTLNKKLSDESINRMSKALSEKYNTVGFYRVYKQNKEDAVQGFQWCYNTQKTGENIQIRSIDLMKVKKKVISRGLDWFVTDEELANKSLEENKRNLLENQKGTNTGFYRVSYNEEIPNFNYQFTENSQKFHKSRVDLDDLKKEVLKCGWEWKITDEEKATKTIEINENNKKKRGEKRKTPKKISSNKKLNQSGIFKVFQSKCERCLKGFTWSYMFDHDNVIRSTDLFKLKEKVLAKGWEWKVVDEEKAKQSFEINNKKIPKKPRNTTGFYQVHRVKNNSKKGFIWKYEFDGEQIIGDNLIGLKNKVLKKGLEWRILDKEKAKISLNRDAGIIPYKLNPTRNKTGLLRVSMQPCKRCANGVFWTYIYGNESFSSVDLNELKKRVLDKNWEWKVVDEKKAKKSFEMNKSKIVKNTNTGFYKVSKIKLKKCKQGFTWRYYDRGQIQSTNLLTLKNNVVAKGLEWKIIDEKLAQESVKLHNINNSTNDDFIKFKSVTASKSKEENLDDNRKDAIESIKKEGTGFFRVYLYENKNFPNGIQWRYFDENKELTSVDLNVLKDKVISNGFEWKVIDEKKAKKSLELNKPKQIKTTNTGFYKVSKTKCKHCRQGFTWAYYGVKTIRSTDLCDLKNKVLDEGLVWKIVDIKKAKNSIKENKEKLRQANLEKKVDFETKTKISSSTTNTGFFRVHKEPDKRYAQGFRWKYGYYDENNKRRNISNTNLIKLKQRVINKKLDWFIVNELKADKSVTLNNSLFDLNLSIDEYK